MDWKRAEEAKAKLAVQKATRRVSKTQYPGTAFQGQGYQLHTHQESTAETSEVGAQPSGLANTHVIKSISNSEEGHSRSGLHRCADLLDQARRHLPLSCCSS